MGMHSIVYGYIESPPEAVEENSITLKDFPYDPLFPFRNIFCRPQLGFRCSVIPFAGSYSRLEDDWIEWITRFEELLGRLHAYDSKVHLQTELSGELRMRYILKAEEPRLPILGQPRKWDRFTYSPDGLAASEEVFF